MLRRNKAILIPNLLDPTIGLYYEDHFTNFFPLVRKRKNTLRSNLEIIERKQARIG